MARTAGRAILDMLRLTRDHRRTSCSFHDAASRAARRPRRFVTRRVIDHVLALAKLFGFAALQRCESRRLRRADLTRAI
jgi:hypothetical protein